MVYLPLKGDIYWDLVKEAALALDPPSDGCSWVPDCYVQACYEHDLHYRWGRHILMRHDSKGTRLIPGHPITRKWADKRLRQVIRHFSWAGYCSPMALWRMWAVRIVSGKIWKSYRDAEQAR